MDSITQIILGVAVAHVSLRGNENWKKTVTLGAALGTLPDLDVYIAKFWNDPLVEIEFHRGFMHSIVFFLIFSFIISYCIKNKFTNTSFVRLLFTCLAILITHSLLDVFTTWGTQIFWPIKIKYALKSIFVVDVAYTLPLLMGAILGLKNKRISFTYAGIFISTLYLIWGLSAQYMIKKEMIVLFEKNFPNQIREITVKPTFSNSILWNVIIQTNEGFYLSDRTLFDKNDAVFHFFPQNKHLISGMNDPKLLKLIDLSENQYTISQKKDYFVFNDLRFGVLKTDKDNNNVQFAFSYELYPTPKGFNIKEVKKENRDGIALLKYVWHRCTSWL